MALNNTYGARPVQQEAAVGAAIQILLVALLGAATGLGPAGWLTGLVFAVAGWAVLARAVHRSALASFGPANRVTLGRAVLVGAVTALVADAFRGAPPVALLVGLTAVALVLDGVDGKVARRTGTSSALGARFDMEVDAFLILVLSVYVSLELGVWVLLIGGMRYAFVAAARFCPWLNASLPPSTARKAVAAAQGVLLLLAASGLLPGAAAAGVVAVALALLVWSFGRDVRWLWRRSRATGPTRPTGATAVTVTGVTGATASARVRPALPVRPVRPTAAAAAAAAMVRVAPVEPMEPVVAVAVVAVSDHLVVVHSAP
ncbi:CDP-alcohol phosphatidyltransferase family protein [Streptomyces sp. NPDC052687]|uniref:CDP-alcohol phosphatidyltransferase family protein n=1 Tax=Streptomyces sp. NPDC052687 TaxID=3154759 RepID=UPI003417245B